MTDQKLTKMLSLQEQGGNRRDWDKNEISIHAFSFDFSF